MTTWLASSRDLEFEYDELCGQHVGQQDRAPNSDNNLGGSVDNSIADSRSDNSHDGIAHRIWDCKTDTLGTIEIGQFNVGKEAVGSETF